MKRKRRNHSAVFKARVAMEALKGIRPIHEIATEFEVHPVQVSQWKKALQENVSDVFERKNGRSDDLEKEKRDRTNAQDRRAVRSDPGTREDRRPRTSHLTGPTGIGKTWLACALGNQACREGFSVLYFRLPRLLHGLRMARADGTYSKELARLARVDVIILDDWGLSVLKDEERRDLLEIVEDRRGLKSTVVTSQLPVSKWHDTIGDPTIADSILDRLVHPAHRIELDGPSMRKQKKSPSG